MTTDILVVGAGPAGVSAALWARALDLPVLLIDGAARPGGQLHAVHFHPTDVPGFEQGDGPALAAAYARQLAAASVPMRSGVPVAELLPPHSPGGSAGVRLENGDRLEGSAVLVATGVRRRHLGVPGERELEGRGVSFSATRDRERLAARRVVVVGGGDAAFENALLLAGAGCDVTLLVRGVSRARAEFRSRAEAESRVTVREGAHVIEILGDDAVRAVRVDDGHGPAEIAAEGVVIKVGVIPNTEWCRGALELDADGYVRIDERMATSAPRVWAAGDVTRPVPPSIPVALGQGAHAVAMIRAELRGR